MASGHQNDLPVGSGSFPRFLEVDLCNLPIKTNGVFALCFLQVESLASWFVGFRVDYGWICCCLSFGRLCDWIGTRCISVKGSLMNRHRAKPLPPLICSFGNDLLIYSAILESMGFLSAPLANGDCRAAVLIFEENGFTDQDSSGFLPDTQGACPHQNEGL